MPLLTPAVFKHQIVGPASGGVSLGISIAATSVVRMSTFTIWQNGVPIKLHVLSRCSPNPSLSGTYTRKPRNSSQAFLHTAWASLYSARDSLWAVMASSKATLYSARALMYLASASAWASAQSLHAMRTSSTNALPSLSSSRSSPTFRRNSPAWIASRASNLSYYLYCISTSTCDDLSIKKGGSRREWRYARLIVRLTFSGYASFPAIFSDSGHMPAVNIFLLLRFMLRHFQACIANASMSSLAF